MNFLGGTFGPVYASNTTFNTIIIQSPTPTLTFEDITTGDEDWTFYASANQLYLVHSSAGIICTFFNGGMEVVGANTIIGGDLIVDGGNLEITLGDLIITGTIYSGTLHYPNVDGTTGQVMYTQGNGTISFKTIATPTLAEVLTAGNYTSSQNIIVTGQVSISSVATAASLVVSGIGGTTSASPAVLFQATSTTYGIWSSGTGILVFGCSSGTAAVNSFELNRYTNAMEVIFGRNEFSNHSCIMEAGINNGAFTFVGGIGTSGHVNMKLQGDSVSGVANECQFLIGSTIYVKQLGTGGGNGTTGQWQFNRAFTNAIATASAAISSAQLTSSFGCGAATAGRGFTAYYKDITTSSTTVYQITSDGTNWMYTGPMTVL